MDVKLTTMFIANNKIYDITNNKICNIISTCIEITGGTSFTYGGVEGDKIKP